MSIKIVVPLKNVPDGYTVTKLTGSVQYTVCRNIKIYGGPKIPEIIADTGVVFLIRKIDSYGGISAVYSDINVICETNSVEEAERLSSTEYPY